MLFKPHVRMEHRNLLGVLSRVLPNRPQERREALEHCL